MILAAGRGTRLAPLTDKTPKPLLPIKGKPLLHWQLTALKSAGVDEVVINLHHLGEQIEAFVEDGRRWNMRVHYSREHEILETGGGVLNALPLLGDEPFLVLNGDIWTDFQFSNLPSTLPQGALAHFVLTPTPAWRTNGDFDCDHGWVTERGNAYCYCGIGVWLKDAFRGYTVCNFSLRDIFFKLMQERRLSCQVHNDIWHDIGTFDQYQKLK